MGYIPKYENDGSGRDTYVNHSGAAYVNPMPGGTFYKSKQSNNNKFPNENTIDPLAAERAPHRALYNQSRYGTTVKQREEGDDYLNSLGDQRRLSASGTPADAKGVDAVGFDPEMVALTELPYDVPRPEQRLRQPGHAVTGTDPTGGVTFNGIKDPWTEPKQVDNTLLRIEPTYESTCHYGLRTGKFYCDDMAQPHSNKLPDKGLNWGKSRYF
eukprot:gene8296-5813_t